MDTQWRQGSLLTDAGAHRLGLVGGLAGDQLAVVISHDCDLASGKEESVELILGSRIARPVNLYRYAKNPRQLHVEFMSQDDAALHLELRQADRRQVSKALLNSSDLDLRHTISWLEKRALKQWLAARYGRPAFPDAFETRLRIKAGRRSVAECITDIVESETAHVVALLFDLGGDNNTELPVGQAYTLAIDIVYGSEGGRDAEAAAVGAAQEISVLFENAYGVSHEATEIALASCKALSDADITLAEMRKADQWRLEYVSLRDEPAGDFLPAGEAPV